MAKPIIAALALCSIVFGVKWYGARADLGEVRARLEASEEALAEISTRRPEANGVRLAEAEVTLTEEQQAALLLAALEQSSTADHGAADELELLRRKIKRLESAVARAEKGKRNANEERQKLLRERQGFVDEIERLRAEYAAVATELVKIRAAQESRRPTAYRKR